MRVLLAVAAAIGAVLLVAWLVPPTHTLSALAPSIAGGATGLAVLVGIAPRILPDPASHYLKISREHLTVVAPSGQPLTLPNRKLTIDAGTRAQARTIELGGEPFVLSSSYVKLDAQEFESYQAAKRGVRYRSPLVQLRVDDDSLYAVAVIATGRYSSREERLG